MVLARVVHLASSKPSAVSWLLFEWEEKVSQASLKVVQAQKTRVNLVEVEQQKKEVEVPE